MIRRVDYTPKDRMIFKCWRCGEPCDQASPAEAVPPREPVCHCGELMKNHTELTHAGYPAVEMEMEPVDKQIENPESEVCLPDVTEAMLHKCAQPANEEQRKVMDTLDAMVRDFTAVGSRPKSEVRRRIEEYCSDKQARKNCDEWNKRVKATRDKECAEALNAAMEPIYTKMVLRSLELSKREMGEEESNSMLARSLRTRYEGSSLSDLSTSQD